MGDHAAGPSTPSILMVTTVAATISRFLTPYARHLRQSGWRVEALANGVSGDPAVVAAFDDVHEIRWSRSSLDVRGILGSIGRVSAVVDRGFEIVHVHTPIASFITRLAVRRMPARSRPMVAYTAHGFHFHASGDPVTNAAFRTAERIGGRWTDRLIVMNDDDERAAIDDGIVPHRRLVRMPGIGVDTAWFSRSAIPPSELDAARSELGGGEAGALFAFVGELSKRKRPGDVVAALARMQDPHARLILVGEGPERPRLVAQIERLGLRDRVSLVGSVEDVRPAMTIATAVVLASSREGLPRAIMEALSLETPVISTAIRGSSDLVGPDVGILVDVGDIPALAQAMDRLAEDRDLARTMGSRGRDAMVEGYDLAILIDRHVALYDELRRERANERG